MGVAAAPGIEVRCLDSLICIWVPKCGFLVSKLSLWLKALLTVKVQVILPGQRWRVSVRECSYNTAAICRVSPLGRGFGSVFIFGP